MKRFRITFAMLLVSIVASAQVQDVLDIVSHDRMRASGCEGPYRFETTAPTPAPKGYKPFYISHYGRHGSRYYWTADIYVRIKNVLEAAEKSHCLSPRGEQLHKDYMSFYELPLINTGDLCELGSEQHMRIAGRMVEDFPGVFAKGGKVLAVSSTSPRAIVSMGAFCTGLQKSAPKAEIVSRSLHTDMVVANPPGAPSELRKEYAGEIKAPEGLNDFRIRKCRSFAMDNGNGSSGNGGGDNGTRIITADGSKDDGTRIITADGSSVLGKLFSDWSFLEGMGGSLQFVSDLYALWQNYHNYTDGQWLEDIFTPEQIQALWEANNYDCYVHHSFRRFQQIPLLMDIITKADEAIHGSGYIAHLRFGHDTVFNSICPLLDLDGCGTVPDNADDVKYWFQNYDTPMAANLQFVFYRSRRHDGILFKILRNGREATLPQLTPVKGPYYQWQDFTSWAEGLMEQHPEIK